MVVVVVAVVVGVVVVVAMAVVVVVVAMAMAVVVARVVAVVVAVVGEGRGPGWYLSGSGTSIGVVMAEAVAGGCESRRFPTIGAYSISSSGLHSELGDDGAASGAGERGSALGEHGGDAGRMSSGGGE